MLRTFNLRNYIRSKEKPVPLYAGSFFFSGAHGGVFTLALPFVILLVGGSDKDVGLCFGVGSVSYLISCLTTGGHLDRFNPKRAIQLSSTVIAAAMMVIFVVSHLFSGGQSAPGAVLWIAGMNVLLSASLALFWPPMMGWLSMGYEGPPLSRRLGIFNQSWSLALAISPFLAGFIIQVNPTLGVAAAGVMVVLAFISVSWAPSPKTSPQAAAPQLSKHLHSQAMMHPDHRAFCIASRFSLVTSCVAIALMRTQFALLFTEDLGYSESWFGVVTTLLCFSSFGIFYWTVRTPRWHHHYTPFVLAQVITAAAMLMILFSSSLWVLLAAAVFVGAGHSFLYASHQYYGVSGQHRRSGSMAVHEILISIGYGGGALIGGYLAEYFGRSVPYWFGLAVTVGGLAIQFYLFYAMKKRPPKPPKKD